jgi:hypothetical protein
MSQVSTAPPPREERFGATSRKDAWWLPPLAVFVGLMIFIVYANIALFQGKYFEIRADHANFDKPDNPVVAPYLAPFYAPLIFDAQSPHAWIHEARPGWWPSWLPFSSAILILIFPLGFRVTCYYYRKAYYRAFWLDPPACAVGERRKSYWGENRWPLLIQNSHRYFVYAAVVFLVLLAWDALLAFFWPVDPHVNAAGRMEYSYRFGVGLGTVILIVNVICLAFFTFGCNSVRHLVGGRLNCFNCAAGKYSEHKRPAYYTWHFSTLFNEHHMLWAWVSLFTVGFADLYVRLCAMGIWDDPHWVF